MIKRLFITVIIISALGIFGLILYLRMQNYNKRTGSPYSIQPAGFSFFQSIPIINKIIAQPTMTQKDDGNNYVPGEILVTFKENTTYKQVKNLFSALGISAYENTYWTATKKQADDTTLLLTVDVFKIKVTSGTEDKIVNKLVKEPIVKSASRNFSLSLQQNKAKNIISNEVQPTPAAETNIADWDINARNLTASIFNAANRYYATKGTYPFSSDINITKISDNPVNGFIGQLIQENELSPKSSQFLTPEYTSGIYFGYSSSSKSIIICFQPKSDQMQKNENTKYDQAANIVTGCKSMNPSGKSCYWCMK